MGMTGTCHVKEVRDRGLGGKGSEWETERRNESGPSTCKRVVVQGTEQKS